MRASNRQREQAVGLLRRRYSEGCLSTGTFEERIERAYGAQEESELDPLIDDLVRSWRLVPALRTGCDRLRAALGRLTDAIRGPIPLVPPTLEPPSTELIVGRDPCCHLVLEDPLVSRRHVALRRRGAEWLLADLGSTNGTWINGWRVERALIEDGDEIAMGATRMVFRPGAASRPLR
ncbi:MAG: FHA domain-containing protein [Actinomycetota bacterium]|nr:FHA domain-containing protein [Actinomycetota bacterium]